MQLEAEALQSISKPKENRNYNCEGYYSLIKSELCSVTRKFISNSYSYSNDHNRECTFELLKLGAMQYSVIKCAK